MLTWYENCYGAYSVYLSEMPRGYLTTPVQTSTWTLDRWTGKLQHFSVCLFICYVKVLLSLNSHHFHSDSWRANVKCRTKCTDFFPVSLPFAEQWSVSGSLVCVHSMIYLFYGKLVFTVASPAALAGLQLLFWCVFHCNVHLLAAVYQPTLTIKL